MIVKLDVFAELDGEDIIDPRLVQRFLSKSVQEFLSRWFNEGNSSPIKLSKSEFDFLKQLGIKSDKYTFLSEEQVLRRLK